MSGVGVADEDMMSDVDENFTELAIDALIIVHNHLYLMEQSIRREIKQQTGHEPERLSFIAFKPETDQQMEHEIGPDDDFVGEWIDQLVGSDIEPERRMSQQIPHEIEPECVAQLQICYDYWQQCCMLRLVCARISCWANSVRDEKFRTDMYEKICTDIAARAVIRLRNIKNHARLAGETEGMDEQRPLKIQHTSRTIYTTFDDFHKLVTGMGACQLDDKMHKKIVDDLMVFDTKRKARVPSRFCSFHLAGFNLDEISIRPLGPPYHVQPGTSLTKYVAGDAHYKLASSSINVISIRVVKVGPDYEYPVEVYGKVIARDEIDYKCVYLFNCEREHAQTICSEKDMLALTGPNRALVTSGNMYFEFDLKIKGNGSPHDDAQFSQGVIPYFCNPDHKRIKFQLPSFHSTVKLVLQHVDFPVAASLEVSVVNQESNDPLVPFAGKITAGTSRNYRHHMLLYDSSVCSRVVSENDSLALNRDLVTVYRYVQDPALVEDEKLAVHVCFLDANFEIEDKDNMDTEDEDEDQDEDQAEADADAEAEADADDEEDDVDDDDDDDEKDREEDPKNVVTLKYPLRETVWEQGGLKLKVKVKWTAVLDKPKGTDFFYRYSRLPVGCEPNYRRGGFFK